MDWFRSVLIQDAPFIRQLEPDLFVWKHPVFSTPTFLAFEARVLAEAQSAEARMSEDARQLIPELSDYLSTNFTALFKATYNIDTTLTGLAASVANNSKLIQEERRAEKYDALLNGIGDAFHAMARRQHSGSISSRSNGKHVFTNGHGWRECYLTTCESTPKRAKLPVYLKVNTMRGLTHPLLPTPLLLSPTPPAALVT